MRAFRTGLLTLAFTVLCCGCGGETQSTSTSPSNEVIQIPKGVGGGPRDTKMKTPTPPPLSPGAPAGAPGTAGGLAVPPGLPGATGKKKP
jgi:hypothetical protein